MIEKIFQEKDFIPAEMPENLPAQWNDKVSAYSNIAIIKYWGKKGMQIPMNASLSFWLPQSLTQTGVQIHLLDNPTKEVYFEFKFEGKNNPAFNEKIAVFFKRIEKYAPYLKYYKWFFESTNNFPHSAGIASSASGFAALAKLLINFEKMIFPSTNDKFLTAKASFLARLGSGSASRSVVGRVAVWGKHPLIPYSNDFYAIDYPLEIHPEFNRMVDLILLLEKEKKAVSSSQGHRLIENHPFKIQRIDQAQEHLTELISALRSGDWELFGKITESEALSLHAMMMTSSPPYLLINPDTVKWIKIVQQVRKESKIPIFFTLDAGANIHVIYPLKQEKKLRTFIPELFELEAVRNLI